jgi:hypothetical protein
VEFSEKQRGVIRGVIPAALVSVAGMCVGPILLPMNALPAEEAGARLAWALPWALLPILMLMISIMRVANHRFASPEDIDGSGLTVGSAHVLVLRAILQNTLEQAVLAAAAYSIWSVSMPLKWLGVIPAAALLFVLGRILFMAGYERGAGERATGFGLTAYPSFGMLATLAAVLSLRLIRWAIGA